MRIPRSPCPRASGIAAILASLASTVTSLATYSPGPSYSVGVPSSSSISSSSTGSIYFQLSASTSYQWVSLGIGTQMAGATMFIMYADGNGNVTLSARAGGAGHVEPQVDSTLTSGVELLAGSGIVGGKMIANVKCTSAKLQSSSTSSSSPWIAAWVEGGALDTTDTSYALSQHQVANTRQFDLDLSEASISSDSNPFISSSATTTTGSTPASTDGASPSSGSGSGDSSSSATVTGPSPKVMSDYHKSHGIIMGVVVALLFPLGAMFMRLGGNAWVHGAIQIFSLAALIAGFGIGVKLAQMSDELYNTTHTIFGTVIVALFLIQPLFGIAHHLRYRRTGKRDPISHTHIWYGRILMVLGIVNGGLGLQLAANTRNGEIAYGVVAGVVGVVYIVMMIVRRKDGRRGLSMGRGSKEEVAVADQSS